MTDTIQNTNPDSQQKEKTLTVKELRDLCNEYLESKNCSSKSGGEITFYLKEADNIQLTLEDIKTNILVDGVWITLKFRENYNDD